MTKILTPYVFEDIIDTIEDFTPYFQQYDNTYLEIMARHGKEIDQLLRHDYYWESEFQNVKTELIKNGHAREHWDDWKEDGQLVRETLVIHGHNLEYFMDDKSDSVRFALVKYHPEWIPKLLEHTQSAEDYNNAFIVLMESKNKELIQYLIDNFDKYDNGYNSKFEYESYKIAYQSMLKEPTLIEQTMSPLQMFQTGNVLWAKELTPNKVNTIRVCHQHAIENDNYEEFFSKFNEMANPSNSAQYIQHLYFNN